MADDSAANDIQVKLMVGQGTLAVGSHLDLVVTGDDTSMVVLTGALAAVNVALEGLTYTPDAEFHGSDTLSITTDDLGNTGGGALQDTDTVMLSVVSVNDRPVNTVPLTPQTLDEDASLTFSSGTGNAISVADADAHQGTGELQVTLSVGNGALTLSQQTGLAVTGNGTGMVELTGQVSAVNAALEGLIYAPDANFNGADSLSITTDDLGNTGPPGPLQDTDTVDLMVTALNDGPVNTVPLTLQTLDEDTTLTFSSGNGNAISVADADAGEGTGEVQVTLAVSNGTLSLGANVGLSFVDGNNTATVVIRGSLTALNTALEGLGYTPDADYSGPDTLTVTTDDLGNTGLPGPLQDIDTVAIQVDAVNDPPVNTVPTTQTLNEDTPLVFSTANGNAITVADVDAEGAGDISVTLTVANGILTLGPTGSLSGFTGDGSGNVALTGQVSAVNAALEDLTYTPNANFNGADSLDITTDDLGNSGSGGPQQDADTIGLQILPVNDAPVVSAPAPQTINQGDSLAFQGAAAIAASDIDIGGGLFMVDIALQTPGNGGSLVLDLDGLILMSPPAATITFFASQTKVNEVLSDGSLVYTPAADFTGTEGVVVTVNDLGGTGLGGALTDTEVVSITVAPSVPLGPIGAVDSTAAPAFTGTDADDVLIGTDGADSIAAGAGDDTVDGGPGNDTLDGGSGNDFLIGSAGDDTFVFEPGSGHDVVKDFVPGAGSEDRLDLRAWGFDDFSDILARTVDVEGDTRIELSDQASIQLVGVASADLHEDDFLL